MREQQTPGNWALTDRTRGSHAAERKNIRTRRTDELHNTDHSRQRRAGSNTEHLRGGPEVLSCRLWNERDSLYTTRIISGSIYVVTVTRKSSTRNAQQKSSLLCEGSTPTDVRFASGGISGGGNSLDAPARDRADDCNPGSHLEAGDLIVTAHSPPDGSKADPRPTSRHRSQPTLESSVDPRHGLEISETFQGSDGMSEYPSRRGARAVWVVDPAQRKGTQ